MLIQPESAMLKLLSTRVSSEGPASVSTPLNPDSWTITFEITGDLVNFRTHLHNNAYYAKKWIRRH